MKLYKIRILKIQIIISGKIYKNMILLFIDLCIRVGGEFCECVLVTISKMNVYRVLVNM